MPLFIHRNVSLHNLTNGSSDSETNVPVDINLLLASGPLFSSNIERAAHTTTMVVMLFVCFLGNSLTVGFIVRDPRLHTPHLAAIGYHAVMDMVHLGQWYGGSIITLLLGNTNHLHNYRAYCSYERVCHVGIFNGQAANLGLIAFERLLYFKEPYLYARLVSIKKIIVLETVIYVSSMMFQGIFISFSNVYYSITLFHCTQYGNSVYFPLAMSLFVIPSGVLEILMVIILLHLVMRMRRDIKQQQVAAVLAGGEINSSSHHETTPKPSTSNLTAEDSVVSTQGKTDLEKAPRPMLAHKCNTVDVTPRTPEHTAAGGARSHPGGHHIESSNDVIHLMRIAIKLVGCISLTYWIFYLPTMVVIFYVLGKVSVVDMELGRVPEYSGFLRIWFVYCLGLTRVVNPIFHFCFISPLRLALKKLIGINNSSESNNAPV